MIFFLLIMHEVKIKIKSYNVKGMAYLEIIRSLHYGLRLFFIGLKNNSSNLIVIFQKVRSWKFQLFSSFPIEYPTKSFPYPMKILLLFVFPLLKSILLNVEPRNRHLTLLS